MVHWLCNHGIEIKNSFDSVVQSLKQMLKNYHTASSSLAHFSFNFSLFTPMQSHWQPHLFRCGYTFYLHVAGSSLLSEPGCFESAFKSGVFLKRYGLIGPVNSETHRFKNGLAQNWLARKVSFSMLFPDHETVSTGNRVWVNAASNHS